MKCYPAENFVIKLICDFEGNIVLKLCAAVKIALHSCMFDANNISAGMLVISGPKGHVTESNFSCNLQCNKRSCKKKFTCNTPFCNCWVARKVEWPSTFCNVARQVACVQHSLCNLKGFLFVIVALLQVARKIALCNMALIHVPADWLQNYLNTI